MKTIYNSITKSHIAQNTYKSLFWGTVTTLGVITTVFLCGSPAKAQNLPSDAEMTSYAKAMLAMEVPRQQAFDEIKKLVGGNEVPKIVCNDSSSMNNLPGKARNIAVNYCNQAKKIVEDNGLSIDRFNRMTVEVQNSKKLQGDMTTILIKLQKTPATR
jgi:Domain of unknown function (DUF4168)